MSRELDALIAEKVMGWIWVKYGKAPGGQPSRALAPKAFTSDQATGDEPIHPAKLFPAYSTDLNDCFKALRKSELIFEMNNDSFLCYRVYERDSARAVRMGEGNDAEAICRAMLAALEVPSSPT